MCKVGAAEARTHCRYPMKVVRAMRRGVEYKFSLGDAVQDCAEFVVYPSSLIAAAGSKMHARGALRLLRWGTTAAGPGLIRDERRRAAEA